MLYVASIRRKGDLRGMAKICNSYEEARLYLQENFCDDNNFVSHIKECASEQGAKIVKALLKNRVLDEFDGIELGELFENLDNID